METSKVIPNTHKSTTNGRGEIEEENIWILLAGAERDASRQRWSGSPIFPSHHPYGVLLGGYLSSVFQSAEANKYMSATAKTDPNRIWKRYKHAPAARRALINQTKWKQEASHTTERQFLPTLGAETDERCLLSNLTTERWKCPVNKLYGYCGEIQPRLECLLAANSRSWSINCGGSG